MPSTKNKEVLPAYDEPDKLNILTFNDEMKINYSTGKKNDFAKPSDNQAEDNLDIKHPVVDVQTKASAATVAFTAIHKKTVLKVAVAEDMTINGTITESVKGDELHVMLANDGTIRTVTFGTGMKASGTVAGTASKTITVNFVHNGTTFVEVSRSAAVDLT